MSSSSWPGWTRAGWWASSLSSSRSPASTSGRRWSASTSSWPSSLWTVRGCWTWRLSSCSRLTTVLSTGHSHSPLPSSRRTSLTLSWSWSLSSSCSASSSSRLSRVSSSSQSRSRYWRMFITPTRSFSSAKSPWRTRPSSWTFCERHHVWITWISSHTTNTFPWK